MLLTYNSLEKVDIFSLSIHLYGFLPLYQAKWRPFDVADGGGPKESPYPEAGGDRAPQMDRASKGQSVQSGHTLGRE